MPYTHLLYHLVFSTKNRAPIIAPEWESRLHAFMGGIIKDLNGQPVCINGMPDHVHLLVYLPQTLSIADTIKNVKARSSTWLNTKNLSSAPFAWQTKYGAFTVSRTALPETEHYIRNQKDHHRNRSFKEEFRAFLERNEIDYDVKYIWE